ncbi:hypothetical protein JHK84_054494 [Glycine max]|nr:hypothetical protein JHK84_054494 [Glycine max]KAH1079450.1 hypothetical protein GYH30_054143 [Glycine max]KAH1196057.1 hypothetical protein GmHk_19G056416 [Glycine max]
MMRCFLPCFRTSKRRNHLRSAYEAQNHVGEGAVEELIDSIAESKTKNEEQLNKSVETKDDRKEEAPQIDETNKRSHQEESSESLFSLSISSRKKASDAEPEVNSPIRLVCTKEAFGSSPSVEERKPSENTKQPSFNAIKKEEETKELIKNEGEKEKANDPVTQYRYRDCPDDGYDDINLNVNDLDATLKDDDDDPPSEKKGEAGADVNQTWVQEESSESFFSLSANSRIRISSAEAENEVNSQMSAPATNSITQGKIPDLSLVLNPIQNLTKGRVVKATLKNDKENINMVVKDINIPISPEPSLKLSNRKAKQRFDDKIGVDTSLSSWLVESSETTPISINNTSSVGEQTPKGRRGSPWSREDRPILGALTVEEIRMFSLSASSRRSRSRSPDETPIIGTVGSYWSHTEQTMDLEFNKSGKDVKPKRSSTALQTRLERAFEASAAEV